MTSLGLLKIQREEPKTCGISGKVMSISSNSDFLTSESPTTLHTTHRSGVVLTDGGWPRMEKQLTNLVCSTLLCRQEAALFKWKWSQRVNKATKQQLAQM